MPSRRPESLLRAGRFPRQDEAGEAWPAGFGVNGVRGEKVRGGLRHAKGHPYIYRHFRRATSQFLDQPYPESIPACSGSTPAFTGRAPLPPAQNDEPVSSSGADQEQDALFE